MSRDACLGFGEFTGICTNEAGTLWTPHWCLRCDELRRENITKSLDNLKESKTCQER